MGRNKAHGNRQRRHVNWISHRYPTAWQQADDWRRTDKAQWQTWCHMPMDRWYAIARQYWTGSRPTIENIADVSRLAALGAWRITQGIYRFDPDLYAALIDTPITGGLPDELLYRLPSGGIYRETPGLHFAGYPLLGVYAHLEQDARDGNSELRLLMDSDTELHFFPQPLRLGHGSLLAAVQATMDVARQNAERHYPDKLAAFKQAQPEQYTTDLAPILSLLLYLCADEADYERPPGIKTARPRSLNKQRIMIIPEQARTWDVGTRIGAALRKARQADAEPVEEAETDWTVSGTRKRPHWRRAHWHTYWTGPLDGERVPQVKWLPPIAVGINSQDMPAVIVPVK